MINHTQKIQFIFSIILFVVFFSVLLFFYDKIERVEQASEQKLLEWHAESARRDEIKSLESLIKRIDSEKALLETHFVQSSNPVPFLDTIERLATSVLASVVVSSVDISKDGQNLIVGVKVTGSFEAFYKFLLLLENSSYELEFTSIDLKKSGGASTSGASAEWSADFKIKLLTFIK